MNKEVRIPISTVNNPNVSQFATQQVLKFGGNRRQYRFDGTWSDTNPGKRPEAIRILMDVERFRRARAVYFSWTEISSMYEYDPVYPEKVIERLMLQNPVTFFIPWGVADWEMIGSRERQAMDKIDIVRNTLAQQKIENRIVLMPADLYATEVNQKLPQGQVAAYFTSVTEEAIRRGYEVKPWSEIRAENFGQYQMLNTKYSAEQIDLTISPSVKYKSIEAARRNSGLTNEKQIQESAYRYLRERICEACIIEERLKPIKLSMAPKNKDNDVDMQLPRLYVLSKNLVLPWKSKQPKRVVKESFR